MTKRQLETVPEMTSKIPLRRPVSKQSPPQSTNSTQTKRQLETVPEINSKIPVRRPVSKQSPRPQSTSRTQTKRQLETVQEKTLKQSVRGPASNQVIHQSSDTMLIKRPLETDVPEITWTSKISDDSQTISSNDSINCHIQQIISHLIRAIDSDEECSPSPKKSRSVDSDDKNLFNNSNQSGIDKTIPAASVELLIRYKKEQEYRENLIFKINKRSLIESLRATQQIQSEQQIAAAAANNGLNELNSYISLGKSVQTSKSFDSKLISSQMDQENRENSIVESNTESLLENNLKGSQQPLSVRDKEINKQKIDTSLAKVDHKSKIIDRKLHPNKMDQETQTDTSNTRNVLENNKTTQIQSQQLHRSTNTADNDDVKKSQSENRQIYDRKLHPNQMDQETQNDQSNTRNVLVNNKTTQIQSKQLHRPTTTTDNDDEKTVKRSQIEKKVSCPICGKCLGRKTNVTNKNR